MERHISSNSSSSSGNNKTQSKYRGWIKPNDYHIFSSLSLCLSLSLTRRLCLKCYPNYCFNMQIKWQTFIEETCTKIHSKIDPRLSTQTKQQLDKSWTAPVAATTPNQDNNEIENRTEFYLCEMRISITYYYHCKKKQTKTNSDTPDQLGVKLYVDKIHTCLQNEREKQKKK